MTELDIIKRLARSIDNRKYPYQIANAFIYNWECDYWTLSVTGETREFEIKISRSDFLVDAKKSKHEQQGANYFYYVCPKDLIKKEEVRASYGLIYIWEGGGTELIKKPRQLHSNKFDQWQMLCNKMYYRWRELWRQKYLNNEINIEEYREGFNIQLEEVEQLYKQ